MLLVFQITLSVDPKKLTLKQLDEDVLKKALNVIEPEVTISSTSMIILTSEDEFPDSYFNRTLSVSTEIYFTVFKRLWKFAMGTLYDIHILRILF